MRPSQKGTLLNFGNSTLNLGEVEFVLRFIYVYMYVFNTGFLWNIGVGWGTIRLVFATVQLLIQLIFGPGFQAMLGEDVGSGASSSASQAPQDRFPEPPRHRVLQMDVDACKRSSSLGCC